MSQSNEVMVFIKPLESPFVAVSDTNIRVAYGKYWIDFRDGEILVRDEKGTAITNVDSNLKDKE